MNEILITGAVGLITTIVSWFLAKKKYNSEVDNNVIKNMQESLDFYEKLSDDNKSRLDKSLEENKILRQDLDALTAENEQLRTSMRTLSRENQTLKEELDELKKQVQQLTALVKQSTPKEKLAVKTKTTTKKNEESKSGKTVRKSSPSN